MRLRLLVLCLFAVLSTFASGSERREQQLGSDSTPAPRDVELSDRGLPVIIYHFDREQRLIAIRKDGVIVVSLDWSSGEVPVVGFGRWRIGTERVADDSVRQTLFDANGAPVRSMLVSPRSDSRRVPLILDMVGDELGLLPQWRDSAVVRGDGSGELSGTRDGMPLRFVTVAKRESVRIGRTPGAGLGDQRVLFWDLDLPVSIPQWARGTVPTRLIVGAGGGVQLASDAAPAGGIESAWIVRRNGVEESSIRFLTPETRSRIRSDLYWVCGYSERWYCTSSGGSGYCETYWDPYYCWSDMGGGGGGGSTEPQPRGGGGTTTVDPEVKALQDQYRDAGCTVPAASDFIKESQYINPGNFTWGEMSDPDSAWAIITDGLRNGIQATRTNYGGGLSISRAYRTPSNNSGTPGAAQCSAHVFGTAADVQIRNANGAHDCAMWDAIALAGHSAGAWVESWAELVRRGTPNHVHLDWGRPANDPAEYGACDPSQLP